MNFLERWPAIDGKELLFVADRHFQMLKPAHEVDFEFHGGLFRGRWEYPGIVSVYLRYTGELVIQSLPGRPTVSAALSRASRGERK